MKPRLPYFYEALFTIVSLILIMGISLVKFKTDPHIPLLIGSVLAGLMAFRTGYKWLDIEGGMIEGIVQSLKSVIILLAIGVLIGVWIQAGVVPAMIYYGLSLLTPKIFLLATLLICSVVSLAAGSWGTAGTIGIAFMGMAQGLGIPPAIAAGAVISGAYFGDKMSPLSDTSNLASAVAGVEVFESVRHAFYTTGLAYVIVSIIYLVLGFNYGGEHISLTNIEQIKAGIEAQFYINPFMLIPLFAVIGCVVYKIPSIPSIIVGIIIAVFQAMLFQNADWGMIVNSAYSGFVSKSNSKLTDDLLSAGGMTKMLYSISLTILAMMFGGIMEKTRQMEALMKPLLRRVKSTGGLIAATVTSCVATNMLLPEQYISIVVPGRMYAKSYQDQGLHPKNLARTLGDAGSLSSALVPWNTCGVFMNSVLGISAAAYAPWALLNYLTPLVAIIYGFTGFSMEKIRKDSEMPGESTDGSLTQSRGTVR